MKKKGFFSIESMVKILFVVLVLVILIVIVSGLYGQTIKDGIKKIFKIETESEKIHEGNIQADKEFEGLLENIEECKKSKNINCGCTFNINNFKENHMILSTIENLKLIDMGNLDKDDVIKSTKAGNTREEYDIKNTNCFFDKNLKKNEIPVARIFFDKEKPYMDKSILIHRTYQVFIEGIKQIFGTRSKEYLNSKYPLFKDKEGNLCWLSEKAKNIKDCYTGAV